ncbi:MAG: hypothetical protein IPN07_07115 [Dehalococcoidia bacterium]|nr:hypothetical protein [Dehalococcoidia bacterium]
MSRLIFGRVQPASGSVFEDDRHPVVDGPHHASFARVVTIVKVRCRTPGWGYQDS